MARKVVGVGSVGTRAWIVLLIGRDGGDPLFLQAKEAEPSVLERFVGESRFDNHGRRVVEGQRLMQATSDIFLGWVRVEGIDGRPRDFYVRQLWDWKGSAEVGDDGAPGCASMARCAGGRWPGPTPAPATPSPSRHIWGVARCSIGRSSTSPRRTPIRAKPTTSPWPER